LQVALAGVLDDVVIHAGLQGLHGQIFRTGAGEHDHRRQIGFLPQAAVGFQAVHAREVVIHHHDVESVAAGLHGCRKVFALLADGHFEGLAGFREGPSEGDLVVSAVFHQQYPQWRTEIWLRHGEASGTSTISQKRLSRSTARERSS